MLHYSLKHEGKVGLEQYNCELEEADAEIERGEFLSHEEALKEIRSWRE
jgi:predicted transcriptional regulator